MLLYCSCLCALKSPTPAARKQAVLYIAHPLIAVAMKTTIVFKKVKRHKNPEGIIDFIFLLSDKFIPHSSNSLDALWIFRMFFYLFAYFFDVRIDCSFHYIVFCIWINLIDELLS